MGFAKIRDIVDFGEIGGQLSYSTFIKIPNYLSATTVDSDLAIAPGNPKAFNYDGPALTAQRFDSAKGIWTGGDVAPAVKHLAKASVLSASASVVPCVFWLCDLLLYYPFIEFNNPDPQYFDNTITLPRYTSGMGVYAFLVSTAPYTGGQIYTVEYVGAAGITRFSTPQIMNSINSAGVLVSTGPGNANYSAPFINTKSDGIRRVLSFQMAAPAATGVGALVLCKPIALLTLREATAAVEKDFVLDEPSMPIILDGAHLNLIGAPDGNWSGVPIMGEITTIWR